MHMDVSGNNPGSAHVGTGVVATVTVNVVMILLVDGKRWNCVYCGNNCFSWDTG